MTEEGFKCPHCGEIHKEYVQWGEARVPMCMKCRKLVAKDLVPKEYIQHRPARRGGRGIALKREVEREEKVEPLGFIKPKPKAPDEVLEEVLKEFGCKDAFIKAMVRRSKRIKGIHPRDLRNYLSLMRSGIKSRDQAAYVADEYAFALDEERDKAREIGYETAYPVERERGYERYELPGRARKKGYYARDILDMMEQKREREEILRIINKLIELMSMAR